MINTPAMATEVEDCKTVGSKNRLFDLDGATIRNP